MSVFGGKEVPRNCMTRCVRLLRGNTQIMKQTSRLKIVKGIFRSQSKTLWMPSYQWRTGHERRSASRMRRTPHLETKAARYPRVLKTCDLILCVWTAVQQPQAIQHPCAPEHFIGSNLKKTLKQEQCIGLVIWKLMSGVQKFSNSIPNICLRFCLLSYRAWFLGQTFFLTAGGVVKKMILGYRLWNSLQVSQSNSEIKHFERF